MVFGGEGRILVERDRKVLGGNGVGRDGWSGMGREWKR